MLEQRHYVRDYIPMPPVQQGLFGLHMKPCRTFQRCVDDELLCLKVKHSPGQCLSLADEHPTRTQKLEDAGLHLSERIAKICWPGSTVRLEALHEGQCSAIT